MTKIEYMNLKPCTNIKYCTTHHSQEGNSSRGMIVNCYEVDHEGSATDESRKERSTHYHLLDPFLACRNTDSSNKVSCSATDWECTDLHRVIEVSIYIFLCNRTCSCLQHNLLTICKGETMHSTTPQKNHQQ